MSQFRSRSGSVDVLEKAASKGLLAGLSAPSFFFARLVQLFERLASSGLAVILTFSVIYFAPAVWLAAHKLMWDDEFFTLYISSGSGWNDIIRALSTGGDQHPPTFYYLTHLFLKLLGTNHVTLRLPEILAYWSMCVCLYFLVRRFAGGKWGVVAMMIPLATSSEYYYATEARGYALLLAFSAFALLCWANLAADHPRRPWFLALLGIAAAAALASHYYGALVVFALGLAELYRSFRLKRIDWPVWGALSCSLVPILIFLPVIRSSQSYAGHFWAHPKWRLLYYFQPHTMGFFPNVLLGVAAFLLWQSLKRSSVPDERPASLPPWMVMATLSFTLIPFFAMLLAKAITNGYVDRYAIPWAALWLKK